MSPSPNQGIRAAQSPERDREIPSVALGGRPRTQKYPKAVSVVHERPEGAAPAGFGGDSNPCRAKALEGARHSTKHIV